MEKIKIVCVNYLNTLPFIRGLREVKNNPEFELFFEHPANCLKLLKNGKVDIGLIPSAGLLSLPNHKVITDFCISSFDKVKTVALFSNNPIDQINKIYLDEESTTSVALLKLLLKHFWKREVEFEKLDIGSLNLKTTEAALMIGDKSFEAYNEYSHSYDLGEYWTKWTGQGFVFAVWAARKGISSEIEQKLNHLFQHELSDLTEIIEEHQLKHANIDLVSYYKENIEFQLTESKRKMLKQFLIELD